MHITAKGEMQYPIMDLLWMCAASGWVDWFDTATKKDCRIRSGAQLDDVVEVELFIAMPYIRWCADALIC